MKAWMGFIECGLSAEAETYEEARQIMWDSLKPENIELWELEVKVNDRTETKT